MRNITTNAHFVSAVLLFGLSTAVFAGPAKVLDDMLANMDGMTLYVFDNDEDGKSVCNGSCAMNWPPFLAQSGDQASGDYTIIMRDDGKMQWAFRGKALYLYSKDKKAGEKSGDGFRDVWHIVKP
ncbi:exported hypothetical protein [Gammaproteobacteria bacterium]